MRQTRVLRHLYIFTIRRKITIITPGGGGDRDRGGGDAGGGGDGSGGDGEGGGGGGGEVALSIGRGAVVGFWGFINEHRLFLTEWRLGALHAVAPAGVQRSVSGPHRARQICTSAGRVKPHVHRN